MSDALDLSRLRALAQKATNGEPRWFEERLLRNYFAAETASYLAALPPDVILRLVQTSTLNVDVNDCAIMSSFLDGCYCDVPEPVERIMRKIGFGSMLKP